MILVTIAWVALTAVLGSDPFSSRLSSVAFDRVLGPLDPPFLV